jgi:hypothetical protein
MIGMLQREEIDVAAASFTVIKERSEGARFLNPFTVSRYQGSFYLL